MEVDGSGWERIGVCGSGLEFSGWKRVRVGGKGLEWVGVSGSG